MARRRFPLAAAPALLAAAVAWAVPAGDRPAPDPLAAVAGPAASAVPPPPSPPPADPFPIRRTLVDGDRLAAALAQAARGELVRLPRERFEARVRAASAAGADAPRLIETRYHAILADGGLTGTADWRVVATGPGLLPLDPLGPAVARPRWEDGTPAAFVHAEPPGRPAGAYLVVDRAGDRAVRFDWSARGAEEPAAERYELAVPPAPVAALDLDLPADRAAALGSPDQLLTGPLPGPAPDRRAWRAAFGGQDRVVVLVRRAGRAGEPEPAVQAHRAARYDLSPGLAACTFDLDLVPLRGRPEEFTLEADAGLQITDVAGPGRLSWRAEPDVATRIRVTSQDPAAVGRVTVTGFTAVPASGGWVCPRVRVVGGLPGRDRIDVRVDPELKFVGCDPGDYRVTGAVAARATG